MPSKGHIPDTEYLGAAVCPARSVLPKPARADGTKVPAAAYLRIREPLSDCPDSAAAIHIEARVVEAYNICSGLKNWPPIRYINGVQTWVGGLAPAATEMPTDFVQRLNDVGWSCLWLGGHIEVGKIFTFLLVIQWQSPGIATRVGAVVLMETMYIEGDPHPFVKDRSTMGESTPCLRLGMVPKPVKRACNIIGT